MSISINPVDFRGFSLGGVGTPQLPNVGALGLQAAQSVMSQQDSAANREAQERMNMARIRSSDEAMLRQSILERQKMGIQDAQFNKGLKLDKQKLGLLEQQNLAEQAYKNQTLGMEQQRFGLDERKQGFNEQMVQKQSAFEQMKMGVEQLAKRKEEELNNIGSFAAQSQIMLNQETDPTKANFLRNEITDQAVSLGIIPKEQAKQFKQLSLSQFKQATGMLAFQADKAKEVQAMSKQNTSEVSLTVGPNGELNYSSVGKKAKDEAEKGLIQTNANYGELKNILSNVTSDMFGPKASSAAFSTPAQEWLSGLPGMSVLKPGEADTEKAKQFAAVNGQLSRLAMDTIKQESGLAYTDSQLRFMMQFIPQVGVGHNETTFKGKSEALLGYLERAREAKQKVLEKGIQFNSDPDSEYGKAYLNELQSMTNTNAKPISEMSDEELLNAYKGIQ